MGEEGENEKRNPFGAGWGGAIVLGREWLWYGIVDRPSYLQSSMRGEGILGDFGAGY